jgi:RNA polymerase sigma factor (sigma-70 family)
VADEQGNAEHDVGVADRPLPLVDLSFEAFFAEQYPRLVRVLVGMTGRVSLAEEMSQEALLSAHREWQRVQALDRPDLWVRRVGVNRAISARRRLLSEVAAFARVRMPSTGLVATSAEDAYVWEHVRRLPRRQAAAMVLWAVEQRSFDEIGDVLGCSAETARTHIRRAREALQRSLNEEGL